MRSTGAGAEPAGDAASAAEHRGTAGDHVSRPAASINGLNRKVSGANNIVPLADVTIVCVEAPGAELPAPVLCY